MKLKQVACIILYDKDKKVLLQHRTKYTKRLPDHWAFFGGSVKKGETPKEAAIREVKEELDFVSKNPKLVMRQEYELNGERKIKNVFVEQCDGKDSLNLHEGQGLGWYDIDETEDLKMISHEREALYYIRDRVFPSLTSDI